jgi:hypothetical protein
MGLAGSGVIAIWNDIREGARDAVYAWHNREHIPERVGIPGFLRGRRFIAEEGRPEFFILYETRDIAAASGPAYFERLNNPTPWTRRTNKNFLNTVRGLCEVVLSQGVPDGGAMLTLRLNPAPGGAAVLREAVARAVPALLEETGIMAVHLCAAKREVSLVETNEREGRAPLIAPDWILMMEGMSTAVLKDAQERLLPESRLGPAERGLYRLEISLSRPPQA